MKSNVIYVISSTRKINIRIAAMTLLATTAKSVEKDFMGWPPEERLSTAACAPVR